MFKRSPYCFDVLTCAQCSLEPGPSDRLTPQRLANFYRSVGGNLDQIFLRTSHSGLSFLYKTIGCFHTLESTTNPFETPSIPSLTPDGFVKWQTVQLLLSPEEHVRYLQEAVRIYDVPRHDGGYYPKSIPNDAFPSRPDKEMENWHNQITSQLSQENYMHRLKNSPYQSPPPMDRTDGYFDNQAHARARRPIRSSRNDSWEEAIHSSNSRRSSEPDFTSPSAPIHHAQDPRAYFRHERRRSQSAGRPSPVSRQRSATTHVPIRVHPPPPSSQRNSSSTSHERPYSAPKRPFHVDQPIRNDFRRPNPNFTPSQSSGSDASSEDDRERRQPGRSRPRQEESRISSLLSALPFSTRNRRCRSHDTSYRDDRSSARRDGPPVKSVRASADNFARPPPTVRFRQDIFDGESPYSGSSSPGGERRRSSAARSDGRPFRNPGLTEQAPSSGYNTHRNDNFDHSSEQRVDYDFLPRPVRNEAGQPLRVATVTGVDGRKYPNTDNNAAGALPPNMNQRDRQRFSLAV